MEDDEVGMKTKQKTTRTPKNITVAKTIMKQKPSTSSRHLVQELDVGAAAAWKVVLKELDIFPYEIQLGQPLVLNKILNCSSKTISRPKCY